MKHTDWRSPTAPPLVSFTSPEQLVRSLGEVPLSTDELHAVRREVRLGLPPVVCAHVLGTLLGVSPQLIRALAVRPRRYYREFSIAKKGGGVRPIATPRVFLKVVQWWILDRILLPYSERILPESVCGFRPRRGTLHAAAPHVGARFLLRCDLADFFGSVSAAAVEGAFRRIRYGPLSAALLARLTTLGDALPQGAPTSPALANIAFARCDSKLERLAEREGLHYSRYADDLFFSGADPIKPGFAARVSRTVSAEGFRLNSEKSRMMGPSQRRIVTGLVISEKAQPPRELRRRLRARFHQAGLRPDLLGADSAALTGWASYVNMYDPDLGSEYLQVARLVLSSKGAGTPDASRERRARKKRA